MSRPLPRVSVVMAVYNREKYVQEAVDSILAQTFADFEFIIVDDGSTDRTGEILTTYRDERIRLVRNAQNRGVSHSANRGISLAVGEYIARMDSDDISKPGRLMAQMQFLDRNPDIDVVGAWMEHIDQDGRPTGRYSKYPSSVMGLHWFGLFDCPVANPAVMARRTFFGSAGGYDEALVSGEDYELWARSSLAFKFSNIQEVLVRYRIHGSSLSRAPLTPQSFVPSEANRKYTSLYLGENISLDTMMLLKGLRGAKSAAELFSAIATLRRLHRRFRREHCLRAADVTDINLDIAHRLSQLSLKSRRFLVAWPLRAYALVLVLLTLTWRFVNTAVGRHPQSEVVTSGRGAN
ncbi:MAG: glycosyltransferase [Actinobacteria bacterium]|nr:glycosyltransferase [Actinomycetota bacterium]